MFLANNTKHSLHTLFKWSNRIYLYIYIYIYAELLFKWYAKLWTEYDINQVTTFIMT